MNILILGSGAREHAFAWKISKSKLLSNLFIAPGNAGTAEFGKNLEISVNNFDAIKTACITNNIEMVFVGPEDPLVNGIYDFFKNDSELNKIAVIGPSKEAAKLEGSKSYAKAFMQRHNIPTASYKEFSNANYQEGLQYINNHPLPIVIKADGLAAGKGVLICQNHNEAITEFELMIQQSKFGVAGKKVVVEEFLKGIELSVFALTDGKNYVLLPEAKDYKRIGEGDTGLNTGGMGAVSPVPFAHETFMQKVEERIIKPTIAGIKKDNLEYKGFIFFGLIKVGDEPLVIEYNCRMGDPETEVVLLRLKNDLVKLFISCAEEKLNKEKIDIDQRCAATIMAVSGGYPGEYEKGNPIDFGYMANPESIKTIGAEGGIMVFHAGTKNSGDKIVTDGGRVLAVSALSDTIAEAIELSKNILDQIHFDGMYYRQDIGYEFAD
ncbi:MAG TPA: phosphoribosylamine--glycine ligase [Chitinophagaceae bacterium]|nr:phosphoribosylamine--glycine ligase [Chitinophagaceae bacterium]